MAKKKKKALDYLFKEMDEYDWSKVPDLAENKDYEKYAPILFIKIITESGVTLEGSILDVCSGQVSLASIYDNVVCFDIVDEIIKELRKKGIKAVMGDVREGLPFEDKTFDYVFASGIPLLPYKRTNAPPEADFNKKYVPEAVDEKEYIENFVDEVVRVSKKKIIIASIPIAEHSPKKYEKNIEKLTDWLVVYDKNKK